MRLDPRAALMSGASRRPVLTRSTPLGRLVLLSALSGLALGLVMAALGGGGARDLGGGALVFLSLLGLLLLGLSPLLARASLARVELELEGPLCGVEGEQLQLPLRVIHGGGRLALRDAEITAGHGRRGLVRRIGLVDTLAPGTHALQPCTWRLLRRGRQSSLRLGLSTSFPFGLVEARLELEPAADVLTLPRRGSLRAFPALPAAGHGAREARRRSAQGSAELRFLRRWREGEDLRAVHWKVSARTGTLVLRELEGEERAVLHLFLVAQITATARAASSTVVWHEGFERAVRLVATLADEARGRYPAVRTSVLGQRRREGPRVTRAGELWDLLEFLAEVEPCTDSAIDVAACVREARAAGELALVVHAGSALRLPDAGEAHAIDVEDPEACADFRDAPRGGPGAGHQEFEA